MSKNKERIVGLESPDEDVIDVRKKNKFGLQWLGKQSDNVKEEKKKKNKEGEDVIDEVSIVKPLNFETHTTTTQSGRKFYLKTKFSHFFIMESIYFIIFFLCKGISINPTVYLFSLQYKSLSCFLFFVSFLNSFFYRLIFIEVLESLDLNKTPEKPSIPSTSPKTPKRNEIAQDHHSTISSKELEHLSPSQIQIQITHADSYDSGTPYFFILSSYTVLSYLYNFRRNFNFLFYK